MAVNIRERIFLGLGLVGAAMVFFAVTVGRGRTVSSIPCPICGRIDDLGSVDPIGIHLDKAVIWNCQCGNTRAVLINRYIPRALIEKALTREAGSNDREPHFDHHPASIGIDPDSESP